MGIRQYIGARYVPKFSDVNGGDWDSSYSYEALEIVKYGNDFYTSKIPVPVGVAINNAVYWVKTGDYNGAISDLDTRVTDLEDLVLNENVINAIAIGCDPTGANDCSSIINAALVDPANDSKILYIPKGIYKISSPINLNRNCVSAGTLFTDSSNTVVRIVDKRICFIFDKIGFAADGNVNSISHVGASNTTLEIAAPSNDNIAYCKIIGNFINGGTAIEFKAGSKFIQDVVIDIAGIFGDQHCIVADVPAAANWVNEIIIRASALQSNQAAAVVLSGSSNNVNGWRFIGCSFECPSGTIFDLTAAKVVIDDCRMSPAEQGATGNIWILDNGSRMDIYGTYEIPTTRINIKDLSSSLNWEGFLDHNAGFYNRMVTKRMDNNEILSFGDKDPVRSKKAVFAFSSNDETLTINYSYDWRKSMLIDTGAYTGAKLNIVYDNQLRALTSGGEAVRNPLACIVELSGSQPVTITSSNGVGGSSSVTLDPASGRVFLLTFNRVVALG